MSPLSNRQKMIVARLARLAYGAWPGRAEFEQLNAELPASARFNAWRRVEQGKACGTQSLRECTQRDYGRLKAHFEALAGQDRRATGTLARDRDNDRRVALHKLREALAERDLPDAYAAAICRRQYRCALEEAGAKQLWRLLYTVRNRRPAVAAPAGRPGDPF